MSVYMYSCVRVFSWVDDWVDKWINAWTWVDGWMFVCIGRTDVQSQALTWWHHQIETFSALLAICAGPVTRSFYIFFDLRLKNGWVNNREAGHLRRYRAHYDVSVMNKKQYYLSTHEYVFLRTSWYFWSWKCITLAGFQFAKKTPSYWDSDSHYKPVFRPS